MTHLVGLEALERKLDALGKKLGGKTLKKAAVKSMTPALRVIRLSAPVGTKAHKTYKGRVVAPGFLKQSISKRSKLYRSGIAVVQIGVAPDAYYGVQFLDRGTKYFPATKWMTRAFESQRSQVESRFRTELKKEIDKVAK